MESKDNSTNYTTNLFGKAQVENINNFAHISVYKVLHRHKKRKKYGSQERPSFIIFLMPFVASKSKLKPTEGLHGQANS